MTTDAQTNRTTHIRDLGNGVTLLAEVSPCVFMYPEYPLQITVSMQRQDEHLGTGHAVDRTKTAASHTIGTIVQLLAGIRSVPCPRCSTPAFDPATIQTNRGGLCEQCFLADLNVEWAAAEEAERQEVAARDRRKKREGMKVRVSAWLHPEGGGDDYQVDWYVDAHPTLEQIEDRLREQGSICVDDYKIVSL